jgi:23S rRNA (cytidine2498-2'-O)-methyltransferase
MTDPLKTPGGWLVRIARIFEPLAPALLEAAGTVPVKQPGPEYWLTGDLTSAALDAPDLARFVRWRLPVHHAWPCNPRKMEGFIEKAAQALRRKFGPAMPQTILCGALDPSSPDPYYRHLAANLRGRALQLLPPPTAATADDQHPAEPTLFCLTGQSGLFCGMASPRLCGGFHPGGTRFIRQDAEHTVSRAGAKLAEALHHLRLHRNPPPPGAHWLELGASPGGMTAELLDRGYRVTAVDRAQLDPRLADAPGLTIVKADAAAFKPAPGTFYQAILCDMNGDPREAMRHVARLSRALKPGGLVIFTLKTTGATTPAGISSLAADTLDLAGGLRLLAETHLTYNRHEFTWMLTR